MKNTDQSFQEPVPLNAGDFMWAVVAETPAIMRYVDGIVNVDVLLSLDETGQIVSTEVVRCNTVAGKAVRPDEPEIVRAAEKAIRVLRFKPAQQDGQPVRRDKLELSFGFSTAALGAHCSPYRLN
jgi:hypothetical protein